MQYHFNFLPIFLRNFSRNQSALSQHRNPMAEEFWKLFSHHRQATKRVVVALHACPPPSLAVCRFAWWVPQSLWNLRIIVRTNPICLWFCAFDVLFNCIDPMCKISSILNKKSNMLYELIWRIQLHARLSSNFLYQHKKGLHVQFFMNKAFWKGIGSGCDLMCFWTSIPNFFWGK